MKLYIITAIAVVMFFISSVTIMPGRRAYLATRGVASWYAAYSPGINKCTANGEIFDHRRKTCAIWGVPFDSMIEVTNEENGRSVTVRVNDRGPALRYVKEGRKIDLTKEAFEDIAETDQGLARVRIKVLE